MRKWVVGLIAAIAVISVGGVGFAAFTSTVTLELNGAAGTLNIEWTGPSSPATTVVLAAPTDTATCVATLSPATILLTFKNIAPNDTCAIPASDGVEIMNTGTLTGAVTVDVSHYHLTGFCSWFFSSTSVFATSTIGPGASAPPGGYTITFGIYTHLTPGNTCQGSTLQWWLNTTATAGT